MAPPTAFSQRAGSGDGFAVTVRTDLTLSRRIRGELHPDTLTCATNTAHDLIATGDLEPGQALLPQTLAATRHILGPTHPDTINA